MIFPFPACNPHVDRQKSYKTTSTVLQAFPPKSLNTRLTLTSRNIIIMIKMVIFRVILLTFKLLLLTGVLLGPEYSVDCPTFYPPSAAWNSLPKFLFATNFLKFVRKTKKHSIGKCLFTSNYPPKRNSQISISLPIYIRTYRNSSTVWWRLCTRLSLISSVVSSPTSSSSLVNDGPPSTHPPSHPPYLSLSLLHRRTFTQSVANPPMILLQRRTLLRRWRCPTTTTLGPCNRCLSDEN